MKVLLISFEFGEHVVGGLGRVINGVTGELRHRLEQLDVFLLQYSVLKLGRVGKLFRCDRAHPGRLVQTFLLGSAEEQCAELIAREGYDVVHVLCVNGSTGKLLTAMAQHAPTQPVVYSVHNLVKHEAGTRKNPAKFLAYERLILERASLVHVLNHTTRGFVTRAYPELAASKPLRIVGNGIQRESFARVDDAFRARLAKRLDPRTRTVICSSRWAHGKGLEHFVGAAERLLAAGHELQFVLTGRKLLSWEKEWYSYVWQVTRRARRLRARLLVLGWLNEAQRNALYQLADVCVMPSELEYYPYSVLEPAAAGVPLICADLPCVTELLRDGEDCWLFRSGDAAALSASIERWAREPELGRTFAARAQAKVLARGDWSQIATEYLAMYREAGARVARSSEAA
jgi:glycosyltransferase involved in cell wall biosynthesis